MWEEHRTTFWVAATMVLMAAAWLAAPPLGPAVALAGIATGWLLTRPYNKRTPVAATPAPPLEPDSAGESEAMRALRHDLRGILSPAMLIADKLQAHADPAVQRAGAVVGQTVERAAARLAETKKE